MQISTPKGKGKEKEKENTIAAATQIQSGKPTEDTQLMKAVKDRFEFDVCC